MSVIRERPDRRTAGNFYDVEAIRRDFPILTRTVNGKPLVFLDSAASAQKPQAVIDAVVGCYSNEYANVHRGVYALSQIATERFEAARTKVRRFLNAEEDREINGKRIGAADPMLENLDDYGGETPTRVPLATSPAIGAGSNPQHLATDQRGRARTFGGSTDAGAVERDDTD